MAERFLGERRSTAAVEFALIGSALFLFLFGIFLMGITQFWQLTLDDAVRNATRQIQIGNVTTNSGFVTAVCNEFGLAVATCNATTLQYSVQINTSFSAIQPATIDGTGTLSAGNQFSAAAVAGDSILVQVAYKLPVTIPLLPAGFTTGNGTRAIISAAAAMVEP